MKKLITILVLVFATVSSAFAQDSAKAKKLLDEVSTKVKSYKNIKIEFKLS
ncbi:MAG: outer membrane lipoprotein carrier protein LolA, partial [Flavobacteriaceae bacterium]|nr:outer membrane lipoprotein carrier protein LolA [Flavobacteriaceae bacterium]